MLKLVNSVDDGNIFWAGEKIEQVETDIKMSKWKKKIIILWLE